MSDAQNTGSRRRRSTPDAAARCAAAGADRGGRSHRGRGRPARCRSGAARNPQRGARSAVCANPANRSTCSIAASARAIRRGCGSMWWPMSLMGRDKRIYRFVQDTRFGRIVIAESHDAAALVDAVTDYVARRMIEREHAMVATPMAAARGHEKPRRGGFWIFTLGFVRRRGRAVRPGAVCELAQFLGGATISRVRRNSVMPDRILVCRARFVRTATPRRRARSQTDYRPQRDSGHARAPTPRARRSRGSCRSARRSTASSEHGRARAGSTPRRGA